MRDLHLLNVLARLTRRNMETIQEQLREVGYDMAVAIATQAEVEAGAACGQLSIIIEQEKLND